MNFQVGDKESVIANLNDFKSSVRKLSMPVVAPNYIIINHIKSLFALYIILGTGAKAPYSEIAMCNTNIYIYVITK